MSRLIAMRLCASLLAALLSAWMALPAVAGDPASVDFGARLYRAGTLPSGDTLRGLRKDGGDVEGAAAACASCHQRSGLGAYEGANEIPPIVGRTLYRDHRTTDADPTLPRQVGPTQRRAPYTDATLARAIRTGINPDGRELTYLMPRYALDDATMAVLLAYLKGLGQTPPPGLSDGAIEFATVITPDADPAARDAMLAVLEKFIARINERSIGASGTGVAVGSVGHGASRHWNLHVWRLSGEPSGWPAQLDRYAVKEPVFALISGIGGRDWSAVHDFCERQSVPCLFPNVDLPVVAENDFYPVYWSRGVLLEADLMRRAIVDAGLRGHATPRTVQLYRSDDVGNAGAAALTRKLSGGVESVPFAGPVGPALAGVIRNLRPGDHLVLWLRAADLAALPAAPPDQVDVLASGLMGGLDAARPPAGWRESTRFTYPFDPPALRRARMNVPLGWLRAAGVPVTDERVQADTYLACQILADSLEHMSEVLVRDFLVERVEMMVGQQVRSGYYPHLGLARGQRFASKGGYLVRMTESGPSTASEWIVP